MLGVVKLFEPLNRAVPPVEAAYQSITLPDDVAEINTVPVPHLELLLPVGTVVILTVAVTAVLVADKQPVLTFLASA